MGFRHLFPVAALALLLAAGPSPSAAAEAPGDQASLKQDQLERGSGTVQPGGADVYDIVPPAGNPAITVTVTPQGYDEGDTDLYCSRGTQQPSPDTADFSSEAIGVNQDVVHIPPVSDIEDSPVYRCGVFNRGLTRAAVSYTMEVRYSFDNSTTLTADEQEVAKELFDRCCRADTACHDWKLANDKLAMINGKALTPADNHTVVQTDLCQISGVCSAGHLTQLNARGWYMACDFPGDLFAKFKYLRALFLAWNELRGDIEAAAKSLSALPLEELGLWNNRMTGSLGASVCDLVQKGTLEMLELGGGNDLPGTLPSCMVDGKSRLYVLGLKGVGLSSSIPDAFPSTSHMEILDLSLNQLTGSIPASLGALPKLTRFTASNNNLTGNIPNFASDQLSYLVLDYNNLTGTVPSDLVDRPSLIRLGVEGNPSLAHPSSTPDSGGGLSAGAVAGICVGAVLAVALVAGAAVLYVRRRRRQRGPRTAASDLKFAKFLDEEAEAGEGDRQASGAPTPFYETRPVSATSPAPAGGVELSSRPATAV